MDAAGWKWHPGFCSDGGFSYFCAPNDILFGYMTQREAIEQALQMLGGRAHLKDIYPLATELGDFSGSQNKEATIRNCLLTSPKSFRHSPGKPAGWWELISYQDEIARLKVLIAEKDSIIANLAQIKTEDDFVRQLLDTAKHLYKRDAEELDVIRKIFFAVGRKDAEEELDAWIEGRESNASGGVTMNNPQFGSMYGISGNNCVNIGAGNNG